MPRLLLINPTSEHKALGNITATAWPPLNLPYLAAVTPSHYQIEVIDENIEPFRYKAADIVGITAYTSSVPRAYRIAEIYKNKGIPTIIGGIHASMMPEEAQQYCDAVVTGEAETVWPTVLKDFDTGKLQKRYDGTWESLENLPFPRRDILKNDYYKWGSIQTSRGCPMNCTFCSVTAFNGRRFRRRPLEAVIDELQQIPQKRILITDDNIIGYGHEDREWTYDFFSRILEKGIKKTFFTQASIQFGEKKDLARLAARAGLKIVFVGIESINPQALESYRKNVNMEHLKQKRYKELIENIRKSGIAVLGAFVLGGDDDDRSVFHHTLKFVREARIDVLQATKPTPLPGTQMWEAMKNEGRIMNQNFPSAWSDYRLSRLVFEPLKMTKRDVYEGFVYLRKAYYGLWETMKRTFLTFSATKSFIATLVAYKFNASYRKAFRESSHYRLYNRSGLNKKFLITVKNEK